jgi:hypothetical protein
MQLASQYHFMMDSILPGTMLYKLSLLAAYGEEGRQNGKETASTERGGTGCVRNYCSANAPEAQAQPKASG